MYIIRGKMSDFFYVQLKKILRKNPLAICLFIIVKILLNMYTHTHTHTHTHTLQFSLSFWIN